MPHDPKTKIEVPVVRIPVAANGRPAVLWIVEPRTAAHNTVLSPRRPARLPRPVALGIIRGVVPIPAPFPYVAAHVVQAEGIVGKLVHGHRLLAVFPDNGEGFFVIASGIGVWIIKSRISADILSK